MDTQRPLDTHPVNHVNTSTPPTSPSSRATARTIQIVSIGTTESIVVKHVSRKPLKCASGQCTGKISLIGHCNHCTFDYCLRHRLPEVHECTAHDNIRASAFEANKIALMSGKTAECRGLYDRA